MKDIKIGNRQVKFYGSIKELPIELSKKMNNYLMQDSGIGSTVADIDDHLAKLMAFVHSDKKNEALEEAKNLRYSLFSAISEIRYDTPAFACLIHSVDGVEVQDRTIDGLNELVKSLEGLTNSQVEEILEEVKKNLIPSVNFTSLRSLQTT